MSVIVRPPEVVSGQGASALSARLRRDTRHAHAAAEVALALEIRLADRGAYGGMLLALRAFYRPLEQALESLPGWGDLTPPVSLPGRRRAHRIDEDLDRLGLAAALTGARSVRQPRLRLDSLARGLGCLYVLEGSALGGRIVALRARAALGDDLAVGFFSGVGRSDLLTDWHSLRASLDHFGAGRSAADSEAVVEAAHQTFAAFGRQLAPRGRRS